MEINGKEITELVHVPTGNVTFSGGGSSGYGVINGEMIAFSSNYLVSTEQTGNYQDYLYIYDKSFKLICKINASANGLRTSAIGADFMRAIIDESNKKLFVSINVYNEIVVFNLLNGVKITTIHYYLLNDNFIGGKLACGSHDNKFCLINPNTYTVDKTIDFAYIEVTSSVFYDENIVISYNKWFNNSTKRSGTLPTNVNDSFVSPSGVLSVGANEVAFFKFDGASLIRVWSTKNILPTYGSDKFFRGQAYNNEFWYWLHTPGNEDYRFIEGNLSSGATKINTLVRKLASNDKVVFQAQARHIDQKYKSFAMIGKYKGNFG